MANQAAPERSKERAPRPLILPFKRALNRLDELNDLLHLAIDGISRVQLLPRLADAVAHVTKELGEALPADEEQQRQHVAQLAEKAKREVERGFPLLHAYMAVGCWSVLEVAVEDFLVAWLKYDQTELQQEQLAKIKVPLSQFLVLDEEERLRFLIAELQHRVGSTYARGLERFESMLNAFGLGGKLDEKYGRSIFELGEIRNVIVHRGGIVDRKVAEACPWLNLKIGDPVVVTHGMYAKYLEAIDSYLAEMVRRAEKRFSKAGAQDEPKESSEAPAREVSGARPSDG